MRAQYFQNSLLLTIFILFQAAACAPSEAAIQTAIAETQSAVFSLTPPATETPLPTNTPTLTPTSTITPTPTMTPTPIGGGSGKIVYTELQPATEKEQNHLYNISILDINSQTSQSLTQNINPNTVFFWPRFSYDGSKIVFQKRLTKNDDNELFTMYPDGSNIQKLSPATLYQGINSVEGYLNDGYPSWSPDGTKIVFSSNRHSMLIDPSDLEIFILDLITFEVKQLTYAYLQSDIPSWSPDGLQIAFMSNRDGDWEIYIMNADGTNVTQITRNTASDRFPRWSPDGQQLIFHSDRDGNLEIYMINADGTNEIRLTTNPASDATAAFSPDGKWIVFQSDRDGDEDIYILDLESGEIIQLTDNIFSEVTADWGR